MSIATYIRRSFFSITYVATCLLVSNWVEAQKAPPGEGFIHFYEPGEFEGMPYRLMSPIKKSVAKRYPLVVSLHGGGSRGTDNVKHLVAESEILTEEERRWKHPCFVLCPQASVTWSDPDSKRPRIAEENITRYPELYQSYLSRFLPKDKEASGKRVRNGEGELGKVYRLIETLSKELPIDPSRIYVVGQSMGGVGTWNAVSERPELFAAAITSASILAPWSSPEKFKDIPI